MMRKNEYFEYIQLIEENGEKYKRVVEYDDIVEFYSGESSEKYGGDFSIEFTDENRKEVEEIVDFAISKGYEHFIL